MRKVAKNQFDWKGSIETLEDRRVMSADPLLGPSIEHQYFQDDVPQIEHQLVSEPDFWIDPTDTTTISEQIDQVEQTLSSAHNTTGLNTVVANYGFTGIGQTVAVIDSGIAYDHFALGGGFGANYRVVGGWDFTAENDADPYDDGPSGSHGTHVAGIIGGDVGPDIGVAPGVDLVALRVFDDAGAGYFSWVENALRWVHDHRNDFENPITAINLSLGVASWNSNTVPSWSTLEDEFAQLEADGIFIAVSAGNSFSTYNTPGLGYPAASPYVVPVMSVTDSGVLASYSQRDVNAIAAPGSSIRSTVPDYRGNNNGITDDYATFSGTSMASPYIAGASVLIRQAMEFVGRTNITQDDIFNHMMATATSFFDTATSLTYKRLNLSAAIDALMPTDDYGSTVATAYNFGSLSAAKHVTGVISTLSDIDYFKFTATTTGSVTFAASNTNYDMDASWTLSNGTGTLSNNGDSFSFDVVAGQTYTVGLSSSGGLGYYTLDVTQQSSFTYTDWGTVTYSQLSNLAANGETWYRVQANQTGYLTVEGMFGTQSGQLNLKLYNAARSQVLATGNANNGTSRVDTYATAGQEFYVCVLGTNASASYRLSNLVSVTGTTVNIAGTSGNDSFSFTAGNNHSIIVDGVTHTFSSLAVNTFNFSGGGGTDTIVMTGTSGSEISTLRVGTASMVGTGFTVATTSVENATVYSSGGVDTAIFYDSAGDDFYTTKTTITSMTGAGYQNVAVAYTRTFGYASTGNDTAQLYDGTGNDQFYAHPEYGVLSGANNSFYNYAGGFDRLYAFASGGIDKAYLYDGVTSDQFIATPTYGLLKGNNNEFYLHASAFDEVNAYSTAGGFDVAYLYDGAGDDQFLGRSDYSLMVNSTNTYKNVASAFDQVYGYASQGNDTANLYDGSGDDTFVAQQLWHAPRE